MFSIFKPGLTKSGLILKNKRFEFAGAKVNADILIPYNLFRGIELYNIAVFKNGVGVKAKNAYVKPFFIEVIPDELELYGKKIKLDGKLKIKSGVDGTVYLYYLGFGVRLDFKKNDAVLRGIKNLEGIIYIRNIKKPEVSGSIKLLRSFDILGKKHLLTLHAGFNKYITLRGKISSGVHNVVLTGTYNIKKSELSVIYTGTTTITGIPAAINGTLKLIGNKYILSGTHSDGIFYGDYENGIKKITLKDINFFTTNLNLYYDNGYGSFNVNLEDYVIEGNIKNDVINFESGIFSGYYDIKKDHANLDLSFGYKNMKFSCGIAGKVLNTDFNIYNLYINNYSIGDGDVKKSKHGYSARFKHFSIEFLKDGFRFILNPVFINPDITGSVGGKLTYSLSGDIYPRLYFKGNSFNGRAVIKNGSIYMIDGVLNGGVLSAIKSIDGYIIDLIDIDIEKITALAGIPVRDSFTGRILFGNDIKVSGFLENYSAGLSLGLNIDSGVFRLNGVVNVDGGVIEIKDSEFIIGKKIERYRVAGSIRNLRIFPFTIYSDFDILSTRFIKEKLEVLLNFKNTYINDFYIDKTLIYGVARNMVFESNATVDFPWAIKLDLTGAPTLKIKNIDESFVAEFYSGKIWRIELTLKNFDFVRTARLLVPQRLTSTSKLKGSGWLSVKGHSAGILDFKADVISSESGFLAGIPFDGISLNADYSKRKLITKMYSKSGVELDVNVDGDTARISGYIDAKNLKTLMDSYKMKGKINIDVRLGKTNEGRIAVSDVSFRRYDWIMRVDDLNGEVKLFDDYYSVNLKGKTLKDFIIIDGSGSYDSGFDIDIETLKGVEFRIPSFEMPSPIGAKLIHLPQGRPYARLKITGADDVLVIKGDVVLNNTKFMYPPKRGRGGSIPFRLFLDLKLHAGENTWFENESVSVKLHRGDMLEINGFYPYPSVRGRIKIDGGNIVYIGRNFLVDEALFEVVHDTVNGRVVEIPYITLKAHTSFFDPLNGTDDTIILELNRNRIDDIRPRFISKNNPELSSERILEMLTGLRRDERQDYELIMKLGVIQLIDRDIGTVARKLAGVAGIDVFRIGYEGAAEKIEMENRLLNAFRGTTISTGKRISERLAGYVKFKLDEYELRPDWRHSVEFEYSVFENLKVKTISELDTEKTLGRLPDRRVLLQHSWRFGVLD